MKALSLALAGLTALSTAAVAQSADLSEPAPPVKQSWSWDGPFGMYDREQLQRGFQVYKEVCSACHSLKYVSFHDLSYENGGTGMFSDAQVKAIAASYKVPAGPNDKGETTDSSGNPLTRPGIPADHFPPPFANEEAARAANGGALPPDQSLLVKAREGGADYVYSIIVGDGQKAPHGFKVIEGKYYDPYFAGRNISMPPPLTADQVTYADGTKATVDQEAKDVTAFLAWAAEPKLENRKRLGLGVMAFMVLLSGLLFLSYRRVWRDEH
ncbi:MAG TPA: cytochrome c1 [Rhizomicrobium sp.]|jgi:ubiquinol-cytochrome c reductase cytochrome c1 subunit|nr:cytochrome c1 [Rhizomicrobium sp.]